MRKLTIVVTLACSILSSAAAHASCTLTATHSATILATDIANPLATLTPNVINFTINCPVGQAWTLTSNTGASNPRVYVYSADSKYVDTWICGPGYTTCSGSANYLYNGMVIASGTGTGAAQSAQLYVAGTYGNMAYTYSGDSNLGSALKVQTYGSSNTVATWFKLVGDVTVTSGASLTYNIQQSCKIASTNNWTATFTGAADVTGSFGVKHICGYGTTVPAINLVVGPGNNVSGELRRAAKSGGYIVYRLFADSAYTTELGAQTNNSMSLATATSSYGTKTIYGKILKTDPHTTNGNGAYTDVVTETISY